MKRYLLVLAVGLTGFGPGARAQSPEEWAQTAGFVAAFQNPDGGFAATKGGPSTLGATSSSLRALKHTGGSVPDVLACLAFVRSCYDPTSGGFAQTPGGKPDVPTTAIGIMASLEQRNLTDERAAKAAAFLSERAEGFEDVRITVAGFEGLSQTSPKFAEWTKVVLADRNPDGTFGKGPARGKATGERVAALLRMGVDIEHRDTVVAAMKAGQRPDGGWSKGGETTAGINVVKQTKVIDKKTGEVLTEKTESTPVTIHDDGPSDLGTTYRVMRTFHMLKEAPDLPAVRKFIASCRKPDGGYSATPGGAADPSGCYYATIILGWARTLEGELPPAEAAGFVPLFNGKDLDGWEGDAKLWSARDGMLVGTSPGMKRNDFLATTRSYGDFILKLSFRLVGGVGNSGVQFRSVRVPGHEMSGYQADMGEDYWGCLYDESRRNRVLAQASPKALEALNKTGWNQYVIRAMGSQITLSLNGVTSVTYREEDPKIARDGKIAVQIHSGGPLEVQFKDVLIQALPTPVADVATSPGFHLRTIKTPKGDRKYTVYVPEGYDDTREMPAVLFLHGSGERGEDGIQSAQIGLGAAIARRPSDFPMIAVFPQARKTWAAGSDDAKAALAALDDVFASFKVDRKRVVLTGLSMGGAGAWEIGAAHPGRFAAVVPICGRGAPEAATILNDRPVWTIVGDEDSDRTVRNTRGMVSALRAFGGRPKFTEYRGIGHNSWDRAYNDPRLVAWMLDPTGHKP